MIFDKVYENNLHMGWGVLFGPYGYVVYWFDADIVVKIIMWFLC